MYKVLTPERPASDGYTAVFMILDDGIFVSVAFTIIGGIVALIGRWRLGKVDRELAVNFVTGMRK